MQKDSIADLKRQMNPESRTMLPKMAFTGFASRYREPTADEGFDDITKVNFKVRLILSCWRCVGVVAAHWTPPRQLQQYGALN